MYTGDPRPQGPDWGYIERNRHKGDVKKAFAEPEEPTQSKNKSQHAVGTNLKFCPDGARD